MGRIGFNVASWQMIKKSSSLYLSKLYIALSFSNPHTENQRDRDHPSNISSKKNIPNAPEMNFSNISNNKAT
jgi:hypothetical protein